MTDRMEDYLAVWFFLGTTAMFIGFIATATVFASRQNAFYYIVCFQVCLLVRYSMRMFFRSARPYMEDYQISPYQCDDTYGNPNTDVMYLTSLSLAISLNPTGGIRPRVKKLSAFTLSSMQSPLNATND